MRSTFRAIDRLVAPLLMAAGATVVVAGLMTFGGGARVDAVPSASPVPTLIARPTVDPTAVPPSPSGLPVPTEAPTPPSSGTPTPGSSLPVVTPSPGVLAPVTRVVVPSLQIDLPVISRLTRVPGQGPDRYPPCDVALTHDGFSLPAEEGTTYIYAHAQAGMFLPLLEASRRRDGEGMLGAFVEVYTADDRLYLYRIDEVKRHAVDFEITDTGLGERQLVLQTSEGPLGTVEKLQVAAQLISDVPADPREARREARPRPCYPG